MEHLNGREDELSVSILPFLPLIQRCSTLYWPPSVLEALKCLSKGPNQSNVSTGEALSFAISDLRNSLGFSSLRSSASLGFSLFFDDLITRDQAGTWFQQVVPRLASLLLNLPALLETHYRNPLRVHGMETALRLLEPQQYGTVLLSQELIAALLTCALFCLFPSIERGAKHLPTINFDSLFVCLYECYDLKQENKIKCIVHYFERVSSCMPVGNVSFERKVLPVKNVLHSFVYPEVEFWAQSAKSLCSLEVRACGLIEDQSVEALEVDFANKYLGGGALSRGCVQEEIRFMINPELIVGMLFLASMADNESIEIVGAERFSNYSGYASSFRFTGDHEDKRGVDSFGRRRTRIIAIDALCSPGKKQYSIEFLLREANKAFCGFLDQQVISESEIGIATGNWGCGAFGGDPQVKAVIQWLAASQATRPFILYYTFGLEELQKLEMVVQWIMSHKWSVGELWNMLLEYSIQRLKRRTSVGFFNWLLPSLYGVDPMLLDVTDVHPQKR